MRNTIMLLTVACSASFAAGDFINPNLPGTTDFDGWDNLSISNPQVASADPAFPGFPGGTPWPEAIESVLTQGTGDPVDDDPTGNAFFDKTSGFGYPSGSTIYASPFGNGTFRVSDTDIIAGLETVVFQIEIGAGSAGFFAPGNEPSLLVNGSTPVPLFDSGIIESVFDPAGPFGPLTINTFGYQWDVSSFGAISSIDIDFGTDGTSTTLWALQLDQGDQFVPVAVPTPGALAMLGVAGFAATRRRR